MESFTVEIHGGRYTVTFVTIIEMYQESMNLEQ